MSQKYMFIGQVNRCRLKNRGDTIKKDECCQTCVEDSNTIDKEALTSTIPAHFLKKNGLLRGMQKVANVEIGISWRKPIKFIYCADKTILNLGRARLYALVLIGNDGYIEILKYGGSIDKGGMKQTLKWYGNGYSGNPDASGRTTGVPTMLRAALEMGYRVEIWMRFTPHTKVIVETITGEVEIEISSYKEIEELWVNNYVQLNGVFPILNLQEQGKQYTKEVREAVRYLLKRSGNYDEELLKNKIDTAIASCKRILKVSRTIYEWKQGKLNESAEFNVLKNKVLNKIKKRRDECLLQQIEDCIANCFHGYTFEDFLNGYKKQKSNKHLEIMWKEVDTFFSDKQ